MIKYANYLEIVEQHNGFVVMFKVTVKLRVGGTQRTGYASAPSRMKAMDDAVCNALSGIKHFSHVHRFSRNREDDVAKGSRVLLKEITAYYAEKLDL